MFFILSKLTAFFQSPIVWVLALLAWGIFKKRKKVALTGVVLLAIISNEWIVGHIFWHHEFRPKALKDIEVAETAIVCGGFSDILMEPRDRVYLNRAADRFMQAVWLYKQGKVKVILVTGGNPYLGSSLPGEASSVSILAKTCGIPDSALLVESSSRSTYENAVFSAALMDSLSLSKKNVLLITSAFHMKRAEATFKKAGFTLQTFPVDFRAGPSPPPWFKIFFFSTEPIGLIDLYLHEQLGIAAYKLQGYSE